ncbi:hypothetical protein [Phenylobacterium sp.]|jgi:hypothetical protein|uniref:hypothetical protein n=1 Tax=Phenylobacterium sp. TaxID=1871053 RepID=UPI002F429761
MSDAGFYAGLSGVTLAAEKVELSHGLVLSSTYAHLTSPCLMAFAPAPPGKLHPAPWRAAKGGFTYDITVQLYVPNAAGAGGFAGEDALRLFLAFLRIGDAPYASAPVLCDMPFAKAAHSKAEPNISMFEVEPRIFKIAEGRSDALSPERIKWLKKGWPKAAELLRQEPKLLTALQACDLSGVRGHGSASLLAIWGALEQLFAPARTELRYRVAANMACYLEPRGPDRLETFKRLQKLYDQRSAAAHGVVEPDKSVLTESWVLLRNALMKILQEGKVPRQDDFEALLFSEETPSLIGALSWGLGKTGHVASKKKKLPKSGSVS